MAKLTVRNLDPEVALRLRQRATAHGCSVEEEIRRVLRDAVLVAARHEVHAEIEPVPLGSRIAARFVGLGFHGELPELRAKEAAPADFGPQNRFASQ